MCLLVAELQVQINLSSPPHKGTIVFFFLSGEVEPSLEILIHTLTQVFQGLFTVRVRVYVSVRVCTAHEACHCEDRPVCHVPLSWYADILVRLASLPLSLTGCVAPARYFL